MLEDFFLIIVMVFLPLFWLKIINKYNWKKIKKQLIPVKDNPLIEIIGGVKLFFALLIGFILLSLIFTASGINDLEKVSEVIEMNSQNLIPYLIIMAIMVFIEEFFFRGFLINKIGIVPSSIIFGVAHVGYTSIAQILGAFILGLILAYWFKQNKSIAQNYLGHLLYNLFAIALYLLFR